MTIEELSIEMRIKDTVTGRSMKVTRMPTAKKRSIGVVLDGETTEKMIWRAQLRRFIAA